MNREDIISMANAALEANEPFDLTNAFSDQELMNFARLIAEDCAKRCAALAEAFDESLDPGHACGADACAVEIREAYKP